MIEEQAEQDKFYHWISEDQLKKIIIKAVQELAEKVKTLEARVQQLEQYHD